MNDIVERLGVVAASLANPHVVIAAQREIKLLRQERDFFLDQIKATKQYMAEHINELQDYILNLDRMLDTYER